MRQRDRVRETESRELGQRASREGADQEETDARGKTWSGWEVLTDGRLGWLPLVYPGTSPSHSISEGSGSFQLWVGMVGV